MTPLVFGGGARGAGDGDFRRCWRRKEARYWKEQAVRVKEEAGGEEKLWRGRMLVEREGERWCKGGAAVKTDLVVD